VAVRERQGADRWGWPGFVRRHLVLVVLLGVLLALTIALYVMEANTSIRVFYRF